MISRIFLRRLWRYPVLASIAIVVISAPLELYFQWVVVSRAPVIPDAGHMFGYLSGATVHYVSRTAHSFDLALRAAIWIVVPLLVFGDILWAIARGEFHHWPRSKPHVPPS